MSQKITKTKRNKERYQLFHYSYSGNEFVGYVFDSKTGEIKKYKFKENGNKK